MVGKWLLGTGALGLVVIAGLSAETGCSVTASSGGGGSTASSMTTGTTTVGVTTGTMSTTGSCMDTSGCEKCNGCVTKFDCGVASTNTGVCKCNGNGMSTSSIGLYTTFFTCLCGADGAGGKCGAKCSKTCKGTGADAADCMTCLGTAAGVDCKNEYSACNADK